MNNNSNNKNPVGDWDVDDLLFWRALESHPPIQGLLKQVLQNGWTLCIPPDTSIPIGYDNSNNNNGKQQQSVVPMPTEGFSKMHVLIPLDQNGNPIVASTSNSSSGGNATGSNQNHSRNSSSSDILILGSGNSDNLETKSNSSENNNSNINNVNEKKNEKGNKTFAQTILAPVNSLRTRTASFFSSLKNSVSSSSNNNSNSGNSPPQQQQKDSTISPRKSISRSSTFSTTTNNNNNNNNGFLNDGNNNNNNNSLTTPSPFQFSKFIAGGKKDFVVYRRTVAEELQRQQEEDGFDDVDDDDDDDDDDNNASYEEEEYFDEVDRKLKKRRKVQLPLSVKRGTKKNSLLREICKKTRFSDDSYSKSLDSSDLGVLVTEWTTTTTTNTNTSKSNNNNNQQQQQQKKQRTVARIVFEQKVVNTESKKSVTFLVLDRPLNAGPGAVPAHLRTFGFSGQSVSDAVDFLFDADAEFVNDKDSLFSLLEKKAAETRTYLDETYCAKLELEDANGGHAIDSSSSNPSTSLDKTKILDQVREYLDDIINAESDLWIMAIVPAAHPLSRRRLERSFQIAVSSFLHSKLYQIVFGLCCNPKCNPTCVVGEVNRWKEVRRKFDAVAGGDDDPVHLGLAPEVWASLRRFDAVLAASVQKAIDSVSAATNPFDKVQRLERVYHAVVDPTSNNGANTTATTSSPLSNAQKMIKLAADNVIPLLAYYLLRSERCELLPVHISYIRLFGNENVLGGASSNYEYALATLEVALSVAYSVFDPVPPPSQSKSVDDDDDDDDEEDDDDDENNDEQDKNKNDSSRSPKSPIATVPSGNNNNNNNQMLRRTHMLTGNNTVTSASAHSTTSSVPGVRSGSVNINNNNNLSNNNLLTGGIPGNSSGTKINSMNRFEASVIRSTKQF